MQGVKSVSKNDKKTLIIISVVISGIIISAILGYFITKINLTNSAVDYLCDKYNATENEFELIDYERSKYFLNDDAIPQIEKGYYKWEFEYKNRSFFVNRVDGKFYDDYQLEDVEKWCVEWLKKNIDESIVLVKISTSELYNYQLNSKDNTMALSYSSIESFINNDLWDTIGSTMFAYYIDANIDENYLEDIAKNKLNSTFYFESINRLKYEIRHEKEKRCWVKYYDYIPEGVFYEE